METLTWTQLGNGNWQANEYPLLLSRTVSHRGRHMWRLRVPHEPDTSYPGGWTWRDALPRGTKSGPLEASELQAAIALVDEQLPTIVRGLPVAHAQAPIRLDPDDHRPHHEQLAELIRTQVLGGDLGPGEQLPTQRRLAAHYGVSKATVHRAQVLLQDEGLLVIKRRGGAKGGGTFVRQHTMPRTVVLHAPADADTDALITWVHTHLGITITPEQAATMRAHLNGNPNRGLL